MHPNPAFHDRSREENLSFAQSRAFGALAVNGTDGPLISHVPFFIEGDFAWLHLVRSNPIARALKTEHLNAVIAVSGSDSYVSPDWYGIQDQVPTWNYVSVHLRGTLELRPDEELRDLLDRESAVFEDRLAPKAPWRTDKMTPDALSKMMRAILPCRMSIEVVDGTWKLNQNKAEEARLGAADHIETSGIGSELATLAYLMRSV